MSSLELNGEAVRLAIVRFLVDSYISKMIGGCLGGSKFVLGGSRLVTGLIDLECLRALGIVHLW